jgi:hypothetical protein
MHVYVVGVADDGGESPVKIGVAGAPMSRLAELQVGNPQRLRVYWTLECASGVAEAIERATHLRLADVRLCGEWFDIGVSDAITAVMEAKDDQTVFVEHPTAEWPDVLMLPSPRNTGAEKQRRYRERKKAKP